MKDDKTGDLFLTVGPPPADFPTVAEAMRHAYPGADPEAYARSLAQDIPMRETPRDALTYEPPATPLPEAHARHTDPGTSHEAALGISPRLRELQEKVLLFAADNPDGFTDIDLNRHFDTHGSTYRTRRAELVEQGLIKDSGERRCYGAGGTGRRHIVWQITLAGLNKAVKG